MNFLKMGMKLIFIYRFLQLYEKNNLYDVTFEINRTLIQANRSFLIIQNPVLKDILLKHTNLKEPIRLSSDFEFLSAEGFRLVLGYYGYERTMIRENNCTELLVASFYFKEKKLMKACTKFIKSHMNNIMLISLLKNINFYIQNKMKDILDVMKDYLLINGYSLFRDGILYIYLLK